MIKPSQSYLRRPFLKFYVSISNSFGRSFAPKKRRRKPGFPLQVLAIIKGSINKPVLYNTSPDRTQQAVGYPLQPLTQKNQNCLSQY